MRTVIGHRLDKPLLARIIAMLACSLALLIGGEVTAFDAVLETSGAGQIVVAAPAADGSSDDQSDPEPDTQFAARHRLSRWRLSSWQVDEQAYVTLLPACWLSALIIHALTVIPSFGRAESSTLINSSLRHHWRHSASSQAPPA